MLGLIVTVTLCVTRPAPARDGQLLEASAVTLSAETLTRLETVEPTIRTILEGALRDSYRGLPRCC
jgi:hypothetical protein